MDTIATVVRSSLYVETPHAQIEVNGVTLDYLASTLAPESNLLGMLLAVDWLDDIKEKTVAMSRFSDLSQGTRIVPILVCPDDLDFSCTVVVVEVRVNQQTVIWTRLGIDNTQSYAPADVGSSVSWFSDFVPLEFSVFDYTRFIEAFPKN